MLTRKLVFAISLLLIACAGIGQNKVIKGKITAFNKYPLANIEVSAKKSKAKIATNAKGEFEIVIKKKDVIKITDPIFYPAEEKVTARTDSLSINLFFIDSKMNNRKAIERGYFTMEQLEYAQTNLAKDNNVFGLFNDVYEAIKFAIPEAQLVQTSGGGQAFVLRGITSIKGNNFAMYVVNGSIVNGISYIVPSEIKRIWKLPTSQLAMYGSRAGNGVICIETF